MTPLDWINIALTVGGFLFAQWKRQPPTLPPSVPTPPVIPQPAPPSSGNPLIDEFMRWLEQRQKDQTPPAPPPVSEPPAAEPEGGIEELLDRLFDVLKRKVGK